MTSYLMYFVFPKGFVFHFIKNKCLCFFRFFIFLLLVFCKNMQKTRHIVLVMYCGVGESVTSLHSFMNAEVLPYFKTLTEICNCTPDV